MLCCALILAVFGVPLAALRALFKPQATSPLSWRLVPGVEGERHERAATTAPVSSFVRKRARSFLYAGAGLSYMVRHEQSCVLHAAATVSVVACGWWLDISREDWRWIAAALAAVWSAEAFNTAIEKACDALSPQYNIHVRIAKDTAAGGVLLISIGAAVTGLLTLCPYFASAYRLEALPVFDIPMCRTGS